MSQHSKKPPPSKPFPSAYPITVPWSLMMPPPHPSFLTPGHPQAAAGRGRGIATQSMPLTVPSRAPVLMTAQGNRGRGRGRPVQQPPSFARPLVVPLAASVPAAAGIRGQPSKPHSQYHVPPKSRSKAAPPPPRTSLRTKGMPPQVSLPAAHHASWPNITPRDSSSPPLDLAALIGLAFTSVMSQPHLRQTWLTETGIMAIIKKRYKFDSGEYDFSHKKLHSAITKLTVGCADIENSTNQTGIFRFKKDINFHGKKQRYVWFYYVTDPGQPMGPLPQPQLSIRADNRTANETKLVEKQKQTEQHPKRKRRPVMNWDADAKKETADRDKSQDNEPGIMSAKERKAKAQEEWKKFYNDAQSACDSEVERRDSKRQRVRDTVDVELDRASQFLKAIEMEKKALESAMAAKERAAEAAETLQLVCYFDSTEAKHLFCPKDGETVQECLKRRIDFLSSAISDPNGYERLLANEYKEDSEEHKVDGSSNEPNAYQLYQMRDKAMYLRLSYMNALEMMDKGPRFTECCKKAIEQLKQATAIELTVDPGKVRKWNQEFRVKERFPPPKKNPPSARKKKAANKKTRDEKPTSGDVGSCI